MKTALDNNVLSALWTKEPFAPQIASRLWTARANGSLVISPVVLAEAIAHPWMTEPLIQQFLTESAIGVDYELEPEVWHEAGRRFALYAKRRRASGGQEPKRLLADFIIGAHAFIHADRLMTLDKGRYQQDFPDLLLL